jgi:hypothetical protein
MSIRSFASLLLVFAVCGCKAMHQEAPSYPPPMEGMKTTATYDVLGATEGSSEGGYILYFIPLGHERKIGAIHSQGEGVGGFWLFSGLNPVQKAALYNAIEAAPGADSMLAPRWDMTITDYFIYQHVTAHCRGKAVRYNPSVE